MTVGPPLPEGALPSWDYVRSCFVEDGVPGIMVVRDTPRVAFFVDADGRRFGGYFETDDPAALTPLATVRCAALQVEDRRCLEFSVAEPSLFRSFYQLLSDLVARVLDGAPVGAAAQALLADWRALLQQAAALSDERQAGLFGELWLLERLIRARGPAAVASWTGPLRAAHDFRTGEGDLEVKTSYGARRVHVINGLSQLTPLEGMPLYLLSLRLQAAGEGGGSLPEAVAQIRALLATAAVQSAGFEQGLNRAGYRDEDADLYPSRRRLADPAILIPIVDGIPRLSRAALASLAPSYVAERIVEVTYRLDVEGLGWPDGAPEFLAVIGPAVADPKGEP